MTTDQKIEELLKTCEKAMPLPWIIEEHQSTFEVRTNAGALAMYVTELHKHEGDNSQLAHDAAFIAAARTALPWALEELKKARKALQEIANCGSDGQEVEMALEALGDG